MHYVLNRWKKLTASLLLTGVFTLVLCFVLATPAHACCQQHREAAPEGTHHPPAAACCCIEQAAPNTAALISKQVQFLSVDDVVLASTPSASPVLLTTMLASRGDKTTYREDQRERYLQLRRLLN